MNIVHFFYFFILHLPLGNNSILSSTSVGIIIIITMALAILRNAGVSSSTSISSIVQYRVGVAYSEVALSEAIQALRHCCLTNKKRLVDIVIIIGEG